MALEPALHIPVRNEADIHTVRLFGHGQADIARRSAGFVLTRAFPQREQAARDRPPRQAVHHIGLILFRAGAQQERAPLRVPSGAGVVAGGDIGRADLIRVVGQRTELDQRVAHHARVRRARGAVAVREIGAHLLLERLAPVRDVKRDAQLVCRLLRGLRAAQTDLQEQPVYRKALRAQARRRDRGIHAA